MGRAKDREIDKDEAWKMRARQAGVGACKVCGAINPQRGQSWWGDLCPSCSTAFDSDSND